MPERQANPGWFKAGFDARRHVLSKEECRKGFRIATQEKKMPSRLRAWLRKKIRSYYQQRRERKRGAA
jgi:hypothetical protein